MRPAHLLTAERIASWPAPSPEEPLRILASGCLVGQACGYDATSYGEHLILARLFSLPNVQVFNFCPEDFSFGTPRAVCNTYGGDGFDVLDGRARVKTDDGEDWTDALIEAAERMLELAKANRVHVAVLMDISAACGSQVIYDPAHAGRSTAWSLPLQATMGRNRSVMRLSREERRGADTRRVLLIWRDRARRRRPETTGSRCSFRFTARDTGVRTFPIHAECCAMHCSLLAALSLAAALSTSVGVADERAARIDALTGLGPSAALAGELEGLRKMLQLLADKPPSGDYPRWSSIAQAGADAARYEDIKGVKKSCRDCHDAYKEGFKRQFPRTSAHPKEKDHGLPLAPK